MGPSSFIELPSTDFLRDMFDYDGETGELYRLVGRNWRKVTISKSGYTSIRILKKSYLAHRVIWKIVTGVDPSGEIDHRDGDKANLKWNNLRLANRSQNTCNTFKNVTNTSGYKGVSFCKKKKMWRADIKKAGIKKFLGYYKTARQAHSAYCAQATSQFGEYAKVA